MAVINLSYTQEQALNYFVAEAGPDREGSVRICWGLKGYGVSRVMGEWISIPRTTLEWFVGQRLIEVTDEPTVNGWYTWKLTRFGRELQRYLERA